MIETVWNVDEEGKPIVAVGRVKNTNVKWAIYLNGKIVIWMEGE